MSKKHDILKRSIEEMDYKMVLLEAVLVSSISEENSRIPTVKEFILSELVNGTIEYIGADAGRFTYQNLRDKGNYRWEICKYFKSEFDKHATGKLDPKILNALNSLCKLRDFSTTHTEELFRRICPVDMHSIYSPPYDSVLKMYKQTLPSFTERERENIVGIGKAMRKFIDKDLEYITKNFSW
jgi:hypothetical protein